MTKAVKYLVCITLLLPAMPCSGALPDPPKAAEQFIAATGGDRHLLFISDTHLGIGRQPDGTWYPTEDFRWLNALTGFLDYLSSSLQDHIDLVIVGDFLELWQPPPGFVCHSLTRDLGCTLDDMEQMTQAVVVAHEREFAVLQKFSRRGENRIHVIPGNHDSTLVYAQIWRHVGQALGSESGRINIVASGTWVSPDGVIVAEHGHQIGADVNGYETWPDIVKTVSGTNYVIRSWGEQFVQHLFNEEEPTYPIIDNLSPETGRRSLSDGR
jgi:UDP-2,3-diacylglucosamine pyrophosphatase LpxH